MPLCMLLAITRSKDTYVLLSVTISLCLHVCVSMYVYVCVCVLPCRDYNTVWSDGDCGDHHGACPLLHLLLLLLVYEAGRKIPVSHRLHACIQA